MVRLVALLLALGAGAGLITVAGSIPGYRRRRRATWALRHAARWVLRALGVRCTVEGEPRSGPSLVVGNHVSWLDVLVLAGSAPMVPVAGSELRCWPVIGTASTRAGVIFLDRNRLRSLPGTVEEITAALRSGLRVQVFPEATARCGGALGEFSRAAFQAALDAAVVVSPVSVHYSQDGDAGTTGPALLGGELLESLRRVLAARRIEVAVRWLAPVPAIAGTGRHHLDRATVTRLVENALAASLAVPIVHRRPRTGTAMPGTAMPESGTYGAGMPGAGLPRLRFPAGPVSSPAGRPAVPR